MLPPRADASRPNSPSPRPATPTSDAFPLRADRSPIATKSVPSGSGRRNEPVSVSLPMRSLSPSALVLPPSPEVVEPACDAAPQSPSVNQQGRIGRMVHSYKGLRARGGLYFQRPEVQRTVHDVKHAAIGTTFAFASAWGLSAVGVTAALAGIFIGQSGIENLATSLPWVGSMLGALIGKGDIYGVGATAFLVETLRRCLMRSQDAIGTSSSATWWSFHVAAAVSLAPLFVPGAVLSGWAVAGALIGVGIASYSATKSLREPGSTSVDAIFCVCMLGWGTAAMPAHLLQTGLPNRALISAMSVPTLALMLVVVKNLGVSLAQRFNLWGNAGPHIERLARPAYFEGSSESKRDRSDLHVVPKLEPASLFDDTIQTLRMANEIGSDYGTPVLWISGRAHDGKQEAVAAFAHAIGADDAILIDPERLPPERRKQELRDILQHVAQTAQRKNRYEVVAIRNIETLVPKQAAQGEESVRSEMLKWLASSEFSSDPRIVFLCLTEDEVDGGPAQTLDEATRSRMGVRFRVAAPNEARWKTVLPHMIYNVMNDAPTAVPLRQHWPRPSDASKLQDVIDLLAAQGEKNGWDNGRVRERLREVQRRLSRPLNEASSRDAAQLPQVRRQFWDRLRYELAHDFEAVREHDAKKLSIALLQQERHEQAVTENESQAQAVGQHLKRELAAHEERMNENLAASGVIPMNIPAFIEDRMATHDFDALTDGSNGSSDDEESETFVDAPEASDASLAAVRFAPTSRVRG